MKLKFERASTSTANAEDEFRSSEFIGRSAKETERRRCTLNLDHKLHCLLFENAGFIVEGCNVRTTREVFEKHLLLTLEWDVEEDIKTNYASNCIIITSNGLFVGHNGVFKAFDTISKELPEADFLYTTRLWSGEIAFLEWQAESDDNYVDDGADTLVIRNGLITAQTMHYHVKSRKR